MRPSATPPRLLVAAAAPAHVFPTAFEKDFVSAAPFSRFAPATDSAQQLRRLPLFSAQVRQGFAAVWKVAPRAARAHGSDVRIAWQVQRFGNLRCRFRGRRNILYPMASEFVSAALWEAVCKSHWSGRANWRIMLRLPHSSFLCYLLFCISSSCFLLTVFLSVS